MSGSRIRALLACLAALAVVGPLAWLWQDSLLPASYSMTDMGVVDLGGGPAPADAGHAAHGGGGGAGGPRGTSVADLVEDDDGPADVTVDLVARQGAFTLPSGREVDGYSLNGTSPGPVIEATRGDLVEVTVRNESVTEGMTLHWHGIDVPNAVDGVAGVTQDAVAVGEEHTYRFVVEDAGTYWYHSHQVSHEQVLGGLFGAIVVHPSGGRSLDEPADALAVAHTYAGTRTLNGQEGDVAFETTPGERVRVRVANTDNGPVEVWTGAPYVVRAVDGFDLNEPTPVTGRALTLTAGARADLEVTAPDDGSALRVQVGGATALVVGPAGAEAAEVPQPTRRLDLLSYGSPAALPFETDDPDRTFDYDIGRRPGFLDGRPGIWWTVNGRLHPEVPMYVVEEGDVVVMRIHNGSSEDHPMHLHGHHAVVLSRDGEPATGSPWWVDSLHVDQDETYEIAFVADNPGLWMDHCHQLEHAAEGLLAHLMYAGVHTPYLVGGEAGNEPE